MSMRIADGLMNFKCRLHFYILIWFICAVYCKTWSALHAIRGFRMQRDPKGNRLPFVTAPKVIWALLANCQRVTEHRMQYTFIFADFLEFAGGSWYPFAFCKKELDTFWSRNKRGQVTLSNKVTRVFSFICYINQFLPWKQIHEKWRKILKVANKVVFVWIRAPAAICQRNLRIARKADHV